jgi:hypothetical protein
MKMKKSCYRDLFLVVAVQTPPRQHHKSSISNSDASKKIIVHMHHHRPIIDYHPGERPRSQNNAFNKAIARNNQLSPDLGFSPCKVGL